MKLYARDIGLGHGGGKAPAMIDLSNDITRVAREQGVGMGKVHVRADLKPAQQRMVRHLFERVPAHMGDLAVRIAGRKGTNLSADPAKALGLTELETALGEELHADADA